MGVFPINLPLSIFSYSNDMIVEPKCTIEFSYGIKNDPCDPSILMDINALSGDDYAVLSSKTMNGSNDLARGAHTLKNEVIATNKRSNPYAKSSVYATNPYISMRNTTSRGLKYFLLWEDRDNRTGN